MKRLLSILLAFALLLSFSSCSRNITKPDIYETKMETELQVLASVEPREAYSQQTEIYSEDFVTDNGLIQVSLQAKQTTPIPQTMPILRMRPKNISIQMAQKAAVVLFSDTPLYEYSTEETKAEIEEIIAAREKSVTDEALRDSFGDSSDEIIESARQTRLEILEYYRNAYASARDDIQPEPCQWKFWPSEHYEIYDYNGVDTSYTDSIPFGVSASLQAIATVNGIPYMFSAANYERENFRNHSIHVYVKEPRGLGITGGEEMTKWYEGLEVYSSQAATGQELNDAAEKAAQMLKDMGFGDWIFRAESRESDAYTGKWQIVLEGQQLFEGFPLVKQNKLQYPDESFAEQDYYYENVEICLKNDGSLISFWYSGALEEVEIADEASPLLADEKVQDIARNTMHSWEYGYLFL